MAAYLKDVENNTRDMTAERIIKDKLNRVETKEVREHTLKQSIKFNIYFRVTLISPDSICILNLTSYFRIFAKMRKLYIDINFTKEQGKNR